MEKEVVTIKDVITDIILNNEVIQKENRIQLEIPDYYNYYDTEESLENNKSNKEPRRVIEIQL